MAELNGDTIADSAGTGAPSFPFGFTSANGANGTFTPTGTTGLNVTSVTPGVFMYSQVGSIVTVSGKVAYSTTGATDTFFYLTLPVASNFTLSTDASGAGATNNGGLTAVRVEAEPSTSTVVVVGQGAGAVEVRIIYQYEIKP